MRLRLRSPLLRTLLLATLLGTCVGATGGFLTIRTPPRQSIPTRVVGRPVSTVSAPRSPLKPVAAPAREPATTPPAATDVGARAAALAAAANVSALVALKKQVTDEARRRGEQNAPATRRLVQEIESHLSRARLLRLTLDGLELRKTAKKSPNGLP